jgi:dihydrofolate reductase
MIKLIVATDLNGVIGRGNTLPWKQREDLKLFKKTTDGCVIIVGRKTFESLPPLKNRIIIVITNQIDFDHPYKVNSIEKGIELGQTFDKPIFICGGGEIYKQSLKYVNVVLLTQIHTVIPDGDTYFPTLNEEWILVDHVEGFKDEHNEFDYTFKIYEKH